VDIAFFTPGDGPPASYFLVVSALVPYKRIDVAIQAAERLGVALKVVGTGPDLRRLQGLGGSSVEFLGHVDDASLRDLYRHARALVLPAEEDFGIAPVESLACGRPVVALGRGGALETIEDGHAGELVSDQTPEAFADAMHRVLTRVYEPGEVRRYALPFGVDRFETAFRALVTDALQPAAC
jgi:glycosyltransferase involved in cell wall biosynthesis